MFLFWLGIFVICCIAENLKDSYDAHKYNKSGGFEAKYPCFKREPYHSDEVQQWLDDCKKYRK